MSDLSEITHVNIDMNKAIGDAVLKLTQDEGAQVAEDHGINPPTFVGAVQFGFNAVTSLIKGKSEQPSAVKEDIVALINDFWEQLLPTLQEHDFRL